MNAPAHIVEQPEHGRDLLVNRFGEVSDVVAHGHGDAALDLHHQILRANNSRRYTAAARAVAALTALPGYTEALYDEATDSGFTPDAYPVPDPTLFEVA